MAFSKTKICILIIAVAAMALMYLYFEDTYMNKTKSLDSIIINYVRNGEVIDNTNDLGVKSVDDISFYIKDEMLGIRYGKSVFEIEKSTLDKKMINNLKSLGIELFEKPNGELIVKYKGEDVKKIVKNNK